MVYVVPVIANGAIKGTLQLSGEAVLWMLAIVVALSLVAGVVTLVPHITSRGQAIEYGLGVNTIVKAIVSAGAEALAKPPS